MIHLSVSPELKARIPDFKIGVICYHHIVIGDMPQIIARRLPLFYEETRIRLAEQPVADFEGIAEWRRTFKKAGTDPSRYRPSQEALLRRIKKDGKLHSVNSAVDLNNFFSVRYGIPLGIYDLGHVRGPAEIRIGRADDQYDGLNGRRMHMENKLVSADDDGAFGSPIVDSKRSRVTEKTSDALQIVYVQPAMTVQKAAELVRSMAEMFTQAHGGAHEHTIID